MEDYSKVTFMEYMEKKKAIIKSLGGKGNGCPVKADQTDYCTACGQKLYWDGDL